MKSVPAVPKQYGFIQIEQLIDQVIAKVKSNDIDQVYKASFNYHGTAPVVSVHNCFKFLGRHQVCAWKNKPYSSKSNMIIASFKLKVEGNSVMQFNVTTGVMLPEIYGDLERRMLKERILTAVTDRLMKDAFVEA